jgi:cell division protein FtsL
MLVLVLIAIGAIYVKADLYYTNPSLALMNFRIYRIEYTTVDGKRSVKALTRDRLSVGDIIVTKRIGEDVELIKLKKKV